MTTSPLQVLVRRRTPQGGAVVVLELVGAAGPLPPFKAGAHVDVHLGPGLVRPYSLCNDPADAGCYRLAVLREPASRGGSRAVHETLVEGVTLTIGPPRNHFPLADAATHSVLVAGGIGLTPLLAMAYELEAAGGSFELHYCTRTRAGAAFLDELAAAPFAGRVHLHVDDEAAADRFDVGRLPGDASTPGIHWYVCGPSGFLETVQGAARRAGLAAAQFHSEHFGAVVETGGGAYDVVAAASGRTVRVAAGQSLLEALATIGIRVPVSCEEGVCGTCVCTVLEGVCDHRDVYLSEDERAANDQILACCSRAASPRLVLDL